MPINLKSANNDDIDFFSLKNLNSIEMFSKFGYTIASK
mgnify:CR=1 FL=1|tara:strand:+ start:1663 stop:1776 length:114 start_codon:yes stop_codon:yes gene_type:complete